MFLGFRCADSENETHFFLAQRKQRYILDIFHAIWIYLPYRQHTLCGKGKKLFKTLDPLTGTVATIDKSTIQSVAVVMEICNGNSTFELYDHSHKINDCQNHC